MVDGPGGELTEGTTTVRRTEPPNLRLANRNVGRHLRCFRLREPRIGNAPAGTWPGAGPLRHRSGTGGNGEAFESHTKSRLAGICEQQTEPLGSVTRAPKNLKAVGF